MVLYIFQLPGILLPSVDPRNQKDDNINALLVVLNVNNHILLYGYHYPIYHTAFTYPKYR